MEEKYQDINSKTIDRWCDEGWTWGVPISHEQFVEAKRGRWRVFLTPTKPVPAEWFPHLRGKKVLGLASGGGQQMPIFAAAGAICTVLDYSDRQLDTERNVAERDGYDIRIVKADMTEPLPFDSGEFDLVFNPVSLVYVRKIEPIFVEVARVLKKGGTFLCGLDNGVNFVTNDDITIENTFPFDPLENREQFDALAREDCGVQFSHDLGESIGGQLRAGFELLDIYDDINDEGRLAELKIPAFYATRAIKK